MLASVKGYKTYIGIGLTILVILAVNVLGVTVQGFAASPDWMNQIFNLATAAFFRSALK